MKLYHRSGGTFGITIYRNQNMSGAVYNDLLVNTVLPELKRTNGGVLDPLIWQQDGAPCHVTNANMQLNLPIQLMMPATYVSAPTIS